MPRAKKIAAVPKTFQPRFWGEVDGRFGIAKEIRARYEALREAAGGDESPQRDMLIQRAVYLGVCLETMETESMETGKYDLGAYCQGLNSFLGLMKTLGLEKRVKSVTDLRTYLETMESAG